MTWKNIHEVVKELQSIDGASVFVLILVALFCPFMCNLRCINYYNEIIIKQNFLFLNF